MVQNISCRRTFTSIKIIFKLNRNNRRTGRLFNLSLPENPSGDNKPVKPEAPQTGDTMNIGLWAGIMGGLKSPMSLKLFKWQS